MLTAVVPLVFVVDDDLSVRKSLSRLLTLAGYTVEAFQSARASICSIVSKLCGFSPGPGML